MPVSQQLLSQIPLLHSLPRDVMATLSGAMTLRSFARRATVMSKDSPIRELGFLVDGRLQGVDVTADGRSIGLYFVDPGAYFGELSVVDGRTASEYVVAAAKSTVAFLQADAARTLIFSNPEMAHAVMARLAQRVRAVSAQRTLLGLTNPFQRLCVLILQLQQRVVGTEVHIDNAPTHQEMAIMINASRETVTRAFHELLARTILAREGNTLRLLSAAMLQDIADGRVEAPKA